MNKTLLCALLLSFAGHAAAQQAAEADFPDHLRGDIGPGVFRLERNILGKSDVTQVLPYAYFDYGRFFARLDTFGVKTVKFGAGYLELAARVNFDHMDAERGLNRRSNSVPIGIGTLQETRFGAFFLNAFYDVNKSHGTLLEAVYAAQFDLGRASFYPQIGIERRSSSYNNYFYGVTGQESTASGFREYHAGASTTPMLGLTIEMPVAENWVANVTFRRKWLGNGIANSPIVNHSTENMGLVAINYHFK
jgi:outer membrane protein